MPFAPVLRAEWLKIRTVRSLPGTLLVLFAVTTAFSAVAGVDNSAEPDADPLFTVLSGAVLGQIAAISFGATAVSAEYQDGALRLSLGAVPRRGHWFAAKVTAIAVTTLLVGLLSAVAALFAGRAGLGDAADDLTTAEQIRGVAGCGVYLTLMALLAAGLAALLRSGVATLSVLIPFVLVVSFVIGGAAGTATDLLPDRAGQVVLRQTPDGTLGPWSGLAVTALWAAAALLAGAWSLRRRDA
ncbi:ABC transporter permease subunit [Streptomyces sp. CHD11]|uniref:ABC transporter permease n=1 Tax=Streptomyces sp. CHD11 TaxID=2741325 RepID=UPI001BFC0975|nr:ABC transporter permease [Streptomyces sp. CHD11]MBT3153975.1 ABC transporter permease subunit [Streptomyces sp. CHD11]